MVRIAFAGLAMLALAGCAAAEEDSGPTLVDLFARTCAQRPALPSELDRIATKVGFVNDHGAIPADMERGPRIDILYFANLTKRGEKFAMDAYFFGPADGPTVSCGLVAVGVSAEALPGLIETSLNAHDRTDKASTDDNLREASWRVGVAGGGDSIEMLARRDSRRASIVIKYRGGTR